MAGVWTMLPLARATTRWFPAVHTGVLGINISLLKAPSKWLDLTLILTFGVRTVNLRHTEAVKIICNCYNYIYSSLKARLSSTAFNCDVRRSSD